MVRCSVNNDSDCESGGARFTEAEAAAADVFARITDSRAALTDTFSNFAQEIKANSKTEDN
jgi:hypothetical protein